MRGIVAAIVAAGLAGPSIAQAPGWEAAAQPTIQQQFEAASTALDTGHWTDALALYQALEARLPATCPRDLGVVRVREGIALGALDRDEEAAAALRRGLPALPASDRSLVSDCSTGLLLRGKISERALDYGEAHKDYLAAEPLSPDFESRTPAIRGLIQPEVQQIGDWIKHQGRIAAEKASGTNVVSILA
ncbi:MAG TPA: hypothetical protein VFW19_10370 [Allosphingosinicella sp.]|nr:hypothetical protein [Allosphingosinicella sp.]